MNLIKLLIIFFLSIFPKLQKKFLISIIDKQEPDELSETEKKLTENKIWPKQVEGTIYIVDGGDEPGEPNFWAVGSLEINADDEISIDLNSETKVGGEVDIDSQQQYRITLDKGHNEYGYLAFPVLLVEIINE